MVSHLVLSKENYETLRSVCRQLLEETQAGAVHVIDRNGVGITHVNRVGFELDVDILSSLVSGNVATANALAALIGEVAFESQIHQGENGAFFVSQLGERLLFIVWFDHASSLGLVRLAIDKVTKGLAVTLDEIDRMSVANANRLFNTQ
ncbi:MAG: roadblock/LC7 domain-containing protein [Bradymonadia bacterium]